ncbi:SGNH/GDSL hydrolase family protein [Muriicola soli]|uniref:SGNH/GDSL hydrolase family protein n=1 Tax=Muriicola soli TaxID=2507538 RepID=UPI001C2BF645
MKKLLLLLFLLSFFSVSTIAQDWAQLGEYQQANKLLVQNKSMEKQIVFFGNSITIGWLHTQPSFFKDKPYINRGIGGQTTPQMLVRFRQDVIDLKPTVVVILAGTNDIAGNTGPMTLEETLANLKSMTELAQANNISVILCSVLPASDYPWRPGLRPDLKIPKLNAMIKKYAEENDVIYLDYFTAMVNDQKGLDPDLAEDGVHPTKKDMKLWRHLLKWQ